MLYRVFTTGTDTEASAIEPGVNGAEANAVADAVTGTVTGASAEDGGTIPDTSENRDSGRSSGEVRDSPRSARQVIRDIAFNNFGPHSLESHLMDAFVNYLVESFVPVRTLKDPREFWKLFLEYQRKDLGIGPVNVLMSDGSRLVSQNVPRFDGKEPIPSHYKAMLLKPLEEYKDVALLDLLVEAAYNDQDAFSMSGLLQDVCAMYNNQVWLPGTFDHTCFRIAATLLVLRPWLEILT
jgi:hypothetical protein